MASSAHFADWELACRGRDCCGRVNRCQQELVDALEDFRSAVSAARGKETPVIVTSAYRCDEHNRRIGGAKDSMHVQGLAADIRVVGMTAAQLETIARSVPAIKGIGRDDHGNYLHIDVRSTKAAWSYDRKGRAIAYYAPGAAA